MSIKKVINHYPSQKDFPIVFITMKQSEKNVAFTKLLNEIVIEEFPEIKFIEVRDDEIWKDKFLTTVFVITNEFPDNPDEIKSMIHQLAKYMGVNIYNIVFASESNY